MKQFAQAPVLDQDEPEFSENVVSFKTMKTAIKHADDYARVQWDITHRQGEQPQHGVVFPSHYWNGGYDVPVWLLYDVSKTDEGVTVTVYRWLRKEA